MKQKVLAMILSMAMVFTLLPATPLHAAEKLAVAGTDVAAAGELELPTTPVTEGNLARSATASAAHTNVWGISTTKMNDGTLATGDAATSWNSWGGDESLYPMPITLTWSTPQTISSTRVLWWSDNGGVVWPSIAYLEYQDGDEWKPLPNVGTEHGDANGGGTPIWNIVNFPSQVTTTALRMRVGRNVQGTAGVGISEWEVFAQPIKENLAQANIVGPSKVLLGTTREFKATTTPESLQSKASYEWSVSPESVASIEGAANQDTVAVKGVANGKATLKLKATYDGISKEAEFAFRVREDKVESIDTYKTTTAAGVAPILPNSVVANGVEFDDPTPSLKSWTVPDFDFAEEFNSSLIPVTWETVKPEDYAKGKEGTTFTVKGKAKYDNKEYDASAEITVKPAAVVAESNSSVTFENVKLEDVFWAPKQKVNALTSLKVAIGKIEQPSGGEPNFDNAIKKLNGEADYGSFSGYVFQDSDIYKSIEAISYTLFATKDDKSTEMAETRSYLEDKLESWIGKIEKVQYADGYLDTFFTLRSQSASGGGSQGTHRWLNLANHEMYNAGHFLEGVVAYTRYREGINDPDYRLYVVGKRLSDHIVATFGPGGKRHEVPGHEEIELAMVKFGKLVEEYEGQGSAQDYYDTVKLLINRRGEEDKGLRESGYNGSTYSQDATSFGEETKAVGHAVRANYFYTGVTDIATMLPEGDDDREAYLESLDTIYDAVTESKTYITGAIGGPGGDSEGYASDYNLAPELSYAEICAAIAAANWNQRMNLLEEDSKYADMVERNLYNSILVGTNLDGNLFFYSTKLRVTNQNQRSPWFDCACCPPNLMRTIAAVSGYMYTVHKNDVFVNMYAQSDGKVNVGGTQVALKQETQYPWEGTIKMTVNPASSKEFTLKIRVPGWVKEQQNKTVTVKVNGTAVTSRVKRGYISITRTWNANDVVNIDIPMEIRMTESHPKVTATRGQIALQRGPIVYCMEMAGNKQLNPEISNFSPLNFVIPRDAELTAEYNEELLNGVTEITGKVKYNNNGTLVDANLQAIPYFAWNNRGDDAEYTPGLENPKNNSSQMLIWTNAADAKETPEEIVTPDDPKPALPSIDAVSEQLRGNATPSVSYVGWGAGAENFADDDPDGSYWNGHGGQDGNNERPQWMMYDFGGRKAELTGMTIRFYDDGGGVMTPTDITVEYTNDGGITWTPVTRKGTWDCASAGSSDKKAEGTFEFEPITANAIRVTMVHKNDAAVAVSDWNLMGDINKIVSSPEDRAKLIEQATVAKTYMAGVNQADYVAVTWSNLQKAITDAEAAAAQENAELKAISAAQDALQDAYSKLDKKAGSEYFTALQAVIAQYDGKESLYSTASWDEFKIVLDRAKGLTLDNAGKETLQSAKKEVQEAAKKLDEKADDEIVAELRTAAEPYSGKEQEYTIASWAKFKDAIEEAERILADGYRAGLEETDAAIEALEKAATKLDKKAAQDAITQLQQAVNSYIELYYTPESWKKFVDTWTTVKAIAESDDLGEKRVNAAKISLETAAAKLVREPDGSTTELGAFVESIKNYKEADYTAESWAVFSKALAEAEELIKNGAPQKLIDAALERLKTAEAALKKSGNGTENPPSSTVDKKALNASIAAAKAKKQADYTPASWNKLKAALAAAQSIAGNAKATQAQVDTAKKNLDAAVKALVKVKITKKSLTLGVKESYSIKSKNCTYTTSDKKKATVSKSGQIKALKTGKITIKAVSKDGKNITQYTVTVKKAPDKKAKVKLNKKKVTLSVKNKKKKTFTIKPKLTSKKYGCATFKYTIDKKGKKVVKVDKKGKVTAKKKGKATITVKTYNGKGKSAKLTITVK